MDNIKYRLALDIGTNSLGWACFELQEQHTKKIVDDSLGLVTTSTKEMRSVAKKYISVGLVKKDFKNLYEGSPYYCGVLTYTEGREHTDQTVLNKARRKYRGVRRNIRAEKWRIQEIINKLKEYAILDCYNYQIIDDKYKEYCIGKSNMTANAYPYYLRVEGLHRKLESHELAYILRHITKHRFFFNNSLENMSEDNDDKWIKNDIELQNDKDIIIDKFDIENPNYKKLPKTLGRYYLARLMNNKAVRQTKTLDLSLENIDENRPKPSKREDVEFELKEIFTEQKKHYSLSDEQWQELFEIVVEQRPLKILDPAYCPYSGKKDPSPKAMPSVITWRILQELHNLRIITNANIKENIASECDSLTNLQFEALYNYIINYPITKKENGTTQKSISFKDLVTYLRDKKLLEKNQKLKGDNDAKNEQGGDLKNIQLSSTSLLMQKIFGEDWLEFSMDTQDEIAEKFINLRKSLSTISKAERKRDREKLIDHIRDTYNKDIDNKLLDEILFSLKTEYANYGLEIIKKVNEYMMPNDEGIVYDQYDALQESLEELGYDNSFDHGCIELKEELPYYGEVLPHRCGLPRKINGKEVRMINNVTVHIALNQVRKLVNTLINRLGHPTQIILEMPKDVNFGATARANKKTENENFTKLKNHIKEKIASNTNKNINLISDSDIEKYKLWESQGGRDLYDGHQIGLIDALDGFKYQVDHIIPTSLGGVNNLCNKALTKTELNLNKSDTLPWEWCKDKKLWEDILKILNDQLKKKDRYKKEIQARLNYLKKSKKDWIKGSRMDNDYLPRQLTDTSYIAKMTREYLSHICIKQNNWISIWTTKGFITSILRDYLNSNNVDDDLHIGKKDRNFHHNHMEDAILIGQVDVAMGQSYTKAVQRWDKKINSDKWKTEHIDSSRTNRRKAEKSYLNAILHSCVDDSFLKYWQIINSQLQEAKKKYIPAVKTKNKLVYGKNTTYNSTVGELHKATLYSVWKEDIDSLYGYKKLKPDDYLKITDNPLDEFYKDNLKLGHKYKLTKDSANEIIKKLKEGKCDTPDKTLKDKLLNTDNLTKLLEKLKIRSVTLIDIKYQNFEIIRRNKQPSVILTDNNSHFEIDELNQIKMVRNIDVNLRELNDAKFTISKGDILYFPEGIETIANSKLYPTLHANKYYYTEVKGLTSEKGDNKVSVKPIHLVYIPQKQKKGFYLEQYLINNKEAIKCDNPKFEDMKPFLDIYETSHYKKQTINEYVNNFIKSLEQIKDQNIPVNSYWLDRLENRLKNIDKGIPTDEKEFFASYGISETSDIKIYTIKQLKENKVCKVQINILGEVINKVEI